MKVSHSLCGPYEDSDISFWPREALRLDITALNEQGTSPRLWTHARDCFNHCSAFQAGFYTFFSLPCTVQHAFFHRSKVKTVDLASFLIQPVQRVLKYPLFLHELLKLIDPMELPADSTYYRDLMAALKLMEHVARLINEETRKKDLSITF